MTAEDAALAEWAPQRPRWEELQNRPLPDDAALAQWIRDWNDLNDAVYEAGTKLSIAAKCDTRDQAKTAAFLKFINEVEPGQSAATDILNRRLVGHPGVAGLPTDHARWLHSVRMKIELFREADIPLHTELSRLGHEYDTIMGAMTAEWNGETRNLVQMETLLQDPDRSVREKAWRKIAERRLQDRDRVDALFDRMVELRERIATNLGLPDFVAYTFKSKRRTDYLPADCLAFHGAVEKTGVPIFREALEARRKSLQLDRLRPWDMDCDPEGRPPLHPFTSVAELIEKSGRIFARLDPGLAPLFAVLREHPLMDLESRVGKAPGGFQTVLSRSRLPFIYMNAAGIHKNVITLLHESGHAFHYLLARDRFPSFNQHSTQEFSEVASKSMELLGGRCLDEYYGPEDRKRSTRYKQEEIFRTFPWVATIDAFQHWIYATPHTSAERREYWLKLDDRFGAPVDWSGLEEFRDHAWHRQLHLFLAPFYYIEYAIAEIGALQVWLHSLEDPAEALRLYKHALSLGGTLGLKDLFTAAGLKFGMDEETLRPLLEKVRDEWRTTL